MTRESIAQAAQKWAQGYAGAGAAMAAGIANPAKDPTQAAIDQKNTMVTEWNKSITNGSWESALRNAGQAGWQAGMTQKTIPMLGQRATVGQPHYAAFLQSWMPAITAAVESLPPRGTFAQNQARSAAMQQWEHDQRGKFRKVWRTGAHG